MQPPVIIQFNASNVPVAQLTVSSKTLPEQTLFDYGLNFIRVRLFTIPGLSTPAPFGGKNRQIMVDIDPDASGFTGGLPLRCRERSSEFKCHSSGRNCPHG